MGRKGRGGKSRGAKGLWLSVCLGMAAAWCAAWLCGMIGQAMGAAGEAQGSREAGFFRGAKERQGDAKEAALTGISQGKRRLLSPLTMGLMKSGLRFSWTG